MLGKLLKYEIPALGRKLVPLYIGWAVTAVFLGLMIGPMEGKSDFMVVLSAMLYAGVATAVFVMAVVMIVQRYSRSLLGDEGYFSHVLPVKVTDHVANKTIAAVVWLLISGIAMILTGIIIAIASGNFVDFFKELPKILAEIFGNMTFMTWVIVLEVLVTYIVSSAKSVLAIYAALTIGHQARNRVALASIGAYIGVMTFESVIGNIMINILPLALKIPETEGQVAALMLIILLVCAAVGAFYFFICSDLMKKKLNLA